MHKQAKKTIRWLAVIASPYVPLMLVACSGVALALFAHHFVKDWENELIRAEFDGKAEQLVSSFKTQVDKNVHAVEAVATFFTSSSRVTRQEFRDFVKPLLVHDPSIQALEWVSLVHKAERTAFENEIRREGYSEFQITEKDGSGGMVRAGQREAYLPVCFVEPHGGNEVAFGYDLASSKTRDEALRAACDSGRVAVTSRIRLVQEREDAYGVLVCYPLYRKGVKLETVAERREHLAGFVVGVFRVKNMLERALFAMPYPGIDVRIQDVETTASGGIAHLYTYMSGGSGMRFNRAGEELLEYSSAFRMGGRRWRVVCRPGDQFMIESRTWHSAGVPMAIILITLILMGYMWFILDHAEQVRCHAAEIAEAKASLEREMLEREQTEREKSALEHELRQVEKLQAVGTLADGIAHGFNNMLAIMLGNAEMASEQLPSDHPVQEDLHELREAGGRAIELVKEILVFSRQGYQEVFPVKLGGLIEEGLDFMRSFVVESIDIHSTLDDDCGTVLANPDQIHQLLVNLCTNAVQAMPDGGKLEVVLEHIELSDEDLAHRPAMVAGPYVQLSVSDTGVGMNADVQERIFEPFFTTQEKGRGRGMGLSVVHGIVDNHNGFVSVESEAGKGSVFRVFLPETDQDAESVGQSSRPLPSGEGHILYVDSDAVMANMVRRMLERLGYQVTTSTSSVSALSLLDARPGYFDLLLAEQAMPEQSGLELANAVLLNNPEMPVILATGDHSQVFRDAVRKTGVRAVVYKPILGRKLAEEIRRTLEVVTE